MKYRHALFLNPYVEKGINSTMRLFPPIGLEYVAASARGYVDKITVLDLRHESVLSDTDKLLEFIRKEIDVICVSVSWDRQFGEICVLLNQMPEGIPLIVGGYKATERVEELFNVCAKVSIIVRGEGEETIKEILKAKPLEEILGISFRLNGKVIHNKNRPLPDVNNILPPDRSLRSNEYRLKLNDVNVTNITFDAVLSARGCPYDCKFCTFNLNPLGQKRVYAARNITSVVDEIASLKADYVLFSDDNLFTNPKRAEAICDLIIARKIKKRFIAQARIEIAKHPQLLKKMVSVGFKMLLIGIESPHDRILAQMDKGFDSAAVRDAFKVLKRYPIYYHGYFIYGNITETEEEMMYIPEFAKEISLDSITLNKLRIEKFSLLRELAEKTPGYHITETGALYSDNFSHAALKKIGKKLKHSFYTPLRLLKMIKKGLFEVKFLTWGEIFSLIMVFPFLAKNIFFRQMQKKWLKQALKNQ